MNFPQFAYNNVRRNGRSYIAYFLSSAFMVTIFFSYAVFLYHPAVAVSELGKTAQAIVRTAEYIVFAFSFLFVLYSISVFLKARNREFGLITILGASSGQLNRLIFLENMMIGAASIVTGIASGLLLAKLFLLASSRFMGLSELPFYWPKEAILLTAGAFLALFVFLSLFTLVFIRRSRVLDLLTGSARPKKEPRASVLLSLLAVLLLGTGLYLLANNKLSMPVLFSAAVLGITGTYFFYTQLSVMAFHLLRRNRRLFWKRTNLLWISEFAYKLKDNARMLFMVTVAISIACMGIGAVLSVRHENEQLYRNNPFVLTHYISSKQTDTEVEAFFAKEKVSYEKVGTKRFRYQILAPNGYRYVELMARSDFEKLYRVLPASGKNPSPPEPAGGWADGKALSLEGYNNINTHSRLRQVEVKELGVTLRVDEPDIGRVGGYLSNTDMLVVEDGLFQKLGGMQEKKYRNSFYNVAIYRVPAWDNSGQPNGKHPEVVFAKKLMSYWSDKASEDRGFLLMRAYSYQWTKETTSMLSFICLFISAIFSVSSASFLYFKLFAELPQDGQNYRSLSRIGLSAGEMKRSVTIQIAFLFLLPTVISAIQTFVVLRPILTGLNVHVSLPPVMTASVFFAAAQLVYFLVVRSRYVLHLGRRMERA